MGQDPAVCKRVKEILVCDSKGIISTKTTTLEDNRFKFELAALTNRNQVTGSLEDAIEGADVFIGVSVGNVVTQDMVKKMNDKPIVFALSNPIPEIWPDKAKEAGAFIVGTGRSDLDNQVNNVLIFPGIFRGALDAKTDTITPRMKISAAYALADVVTDPTVDKILPEVLDKTVAYKVAEEVAKAAAYERVQYAYS